MALSGMPAPFLRSMHDPCGKVTAVSWVGLRLLEESGLAADSDPVTRKRRCPNLATEVADGAPARFVDAQKE